VKLTVKERILVAAGIDQWKLEDEITGPNSLTYDGLSKALNVTRSHIAGDIKDLTRSQDIIMELRHVEGHNAQLRCCVLTGKGLKLRERIITACGPDADLPSLIRKQGTNKAVTLEQVRREVRLLRERVDKLEDYVNKATGAN
jgi:hypothetical protein